MSKSKTICFLFGLPLLFAFGSGPARAAYYCYPYPAGGPGGYNRLTHSCNPLYGLAPHYARAHAVEVGNGPAIFDRWGNLKSREGRRFRTSGEGRGKAFAGNPYGNKGGLWTPAKLQRK